MSENVASKKASFPGTFWAANTIELFERAAFYAVASFVVIYFHETLGMSPSMSTFLNGSLLWGLVYFLPILSGTLADKYGFKRSLMVAFVLIGAGYFVLGTVQQFWPGMVGTDTALAIDYTIPVVLGIILIGIGGSIVKPCIAGTVQRTAGTNATLAFGIFYMVINVGSMTGRGVSYFVRTSMGIPAIFTFVATSFALIGLLVVIFIYKEPEYVSDGKKDGQQVAKKTLKQALAGIFLVLTDIKFVFFLVVIGFYWFIYVQIYNLIPLFLRHLDPKAPVEIYTLANPVMIVLFQLLITKLTKAWTPIKAIMAGIIVTTLGMLVNVLPILLYPSDYARKITVLGILFPIATIFVLISFASMAIGEMLLASRQFQYIGAIAPKGQEGLYLGYANLPMAFGTLVGAPIGGIMYEHFIEAPAKLGQAIDPISMWLLVAGMGVVSLVGVAFYNNFMKKAILAKEEKK